MQSQMNVRIDEKLRQEGNMAWESIGVSPSEAVRMLWKVAAKNRNNPKRMREIRRAIEADRLAVSDTDAPNTNASDESASLAEQGSRILAEFRKKHGLPEYSPVASMNTKEALDYYEQLKESAYNDRMIEKGY